LYYPARLASAVGAEKRLLIIFGCVRRLLRALYGATTITVLIFFGYVGRQRNRPYRYNSRGGFVISAIGVMLRLGFLPLLPLSGVVGLFKKKDVWRFFVAIGCGTLVVGSVFLSNLSRGKQCWALLLVLFW